MIDAASRGVWSNARLIIVIVIAVETRPSLCGRIKKKKNLVPRIENVSKESGGGRWYVISGGRLFVTFLVRLSSGVDDGLPLRHAFRHVLEQNFGQLTHLFSSLVQSFASCNEVLPVRTIDSQCQSESTRVSPSQFVSVSQCSSVPFFW